MNVEDKNLNDHINLLEIKLEKIYQEKAKGAQVRPREQWVELGEKNNSYFLGLKRKRQVKKSINKIKNENNDIATKQSGILEIIKTYYEKLYSSIKHMLQKYIFETPPINQINICYKSIFLKLNCLKRGIHYYWIMLDQYRF